MKLVTRIFLQAVTGFFLLSQVIFFYTLYETQQENLEDVQRYEENDFISRIDKMDRLLLEQGGYKSDDLIYPTLLTAAFRKVFENNAVLYQAGEVRYNGTGYEFDSAGLAGLTKSIERNETEGRMPVVTSLGGKKLLLLYFQPSIKEMTGMARSYQIVWYRDVTEIYERIQRLALRGLVFLAVVFVLAGGVFYLSLRRTLQPLQDLKEAAADIAVGEYGRRVATARQDEIGELAASFNHMAEEIQIHMQKLSQVNEKQNRLLASLAHEWKTPMTAIIGFSDTLLTLQLGEAQRIQALTYIGNECRRLSRLSAKLMELVGLYGLQEGWEAGRDAGQSLASAGSSGISARHAGQGGSHSTAEMKRVAFPELLKQVEALTERSLRDGGLKLVVCCEQPAAVREMDRDLMTSLLLNLVDNSRKASRPGGKILLWAGSDRITVTDFGKGIPKEEVERVTEAFYMVDKSRAKSEGSIGLGLAICQQIAAIHGAMLQIESEEGKGTKVSVIWESR